MSEKKKIIFVCEHGAAKSIVAATYFNKLAQERGLQVQALARGTNPDLGLSGYAVAGPLGDGLTPSQLTPQKLLPEELEWERQVRAYPIAALVVAGVAGYLLGLRSGAPILAAVGETATRRVTGLVNAGFGDDE